MARFLHFAPVLSCESKNGDFGRNDKSEWVNERGEGRGIREKGEGKEKKVYPVIPSNPSKGRTYRGRTFSAAGVEYQESGYQWNRGTGNCHPQTKFEAATRRNIC